MGEQGGGSRGNGGCPKGTGGYAMGEGGYAMGDGGCPKGTSGYAKGTSGYAMGEGGYAMGDGGCPKGTSGYAKGTSGCARGNAVRSRGWVVCVVVLLGLANLARAQGRTGALAAAVRQAEARQAAVWITYRVPIVPGPRRLCFTEVSGRAGDPGDLHLAASSASELVVFARVADGRVERIRSFTPDCPVDAGNTPIVAVADVAPADSVAWLAALVASNDEGRPDRIVDAALLALSLHADESALPRLIGIARDDPRTRVRGKALFWLAERAGDRAAGVIAGAVDNDPDVEVRKKAVFALSQLPKDEGVPKLIEVARTNRHPAVRRQAIFWLGQSHDPRAVSFFEEILKKD